MKINIHRRQCVSFNSNIYARGILKRDVTEQEIVAKLANSQEISDR